MPWVRFGRQARWHDRSPDNPEHVTEAARDLFNEARGGEQPSVYFAATPVEARSVAVVYALTNRNPGILDYVLLPDDAFGDPPPSSCPDGTLVPYLSERHHEVPGIDQDRAEKIARSALQAGAQSVRLREADIRIAAVSWLEDPDVVGRLTQRWARLLGVDPAD